MTAVVAIPRSPAVRDADRAALDLCSARIGRSDLTVSLHLDAARASNAASPAAHLNLDVRHSLGILDLSVTVDAKNDAADKLDGSGKQFKMFGERTQRGSTRALDLAPGIPVVRMRLRSADGKFDQTRTERLNLARRLWRTSESWPISRICRWSRANSLPRGHGVRRAGSLRRRRSLLGVTTAAPHDPNIPAPDREFPL